MVAAFANSPVHAGVRTGWKSERQRVWQELDPQRTAVPAGADPVSAWADYTLDAPVMLQRRDGPSWAVEPGHTFRGWLAREDGPTAEDLALHMTTLFPPVRPRGWFEVRYLDAQPWEWWPVPMAVLTALLEDEAAADVAVLACHGLDDWVAAARDGLASSGLQAAATACFDAALAALVRMGEHADLVALVAGFRDRYVCLGRCPADDPLEVR
jgi:glutamate--cysteine ligase